MTGAYLGDESGIATHVLLADVLRMLGADGVIHPDTGGLFSFTRASGDALNDRLRRPLGATS
ncbi:MAG: hypothetical protein U0166_14625 [Acidobacteriota bacterium]